MAATGRRGALAWIVGFPALLRGELLDELREVLARMATGLSAGNVSAFLIPVDRKMPGFEELRQELTGLTNAVEVNSSVEIQSAAGDGGRQSAKVDWYLSLRPKNEGIVANQRRALLTVDFERRGKRWIVVGIVPGSFFKLVP